MCLTTKLSIVRLRNNANVNDKLYCTTLPLETKSVYLCVAHYYSTSRGPLLLSLLQCHSNDSIQQQHFHNGTTGDDDAGIVHASRQSF